MGARNSGLGKFKQSSYQEEPFHGSSYYSAFIYLFRVFKVFCTHYLTNLYNNPAFIFLLLQVEKLAIPHSFTLELTPNEQ